MPCIVTSVHDSAALAVTCRRHNLSPPEEGRLRLDQMDASGWIVRLPGLHSPIVIDLLTGLVAYHPRDNAFVPYGRIMLFIRSFYHIRAELQQRDHVPKSRNQVNKRNRLVVAREVV